MQSWSECTTAGGVAYMRGWIGASGDSTAPLCVLVHGTGFHALIWEPTVEALGRTLGTSIEVVAADLSGHGLSRPLPGSGASGSRCDWSVVGPRDLSEVLADVLNEPRPVFGIGHSFGGGSLVLAELARAGTFSGLILLEPVLRPEPKEGKHPLAEVLRRPISTLTRVLKPNY
jgi:pimeloyl-ACP methyl ester carboxylesterase